MWREEFSSSADEAKAMSLLHDLLRLRELKRGVVTGEDGASLRLLEMRLVLRVSMVANAERVR